MKIVWSARGRAPGDRLPEGVTVRKKAVGLRVAVVLLTACTSGAGCSWEWAHRIYPIPFYKTGVTMKRSPLLLERPPRRIAVLPFTFQQKDNPERRQAVAVLRETFDLGLRRLRSYEVVDPAEVDRRLQTAGINATDLKTHTPEEIAELTGADALIYGEVRRTRNVTIYVYSHTVYEATLRLVDASGVLLWSGKLWEGTRAGLFVEPFFVDMATSQPENKKIPQAYRRVAERMVLKLIDTIPEPTKTASVPMEKR